MLKENNSNNTYNALLATSYCSYIQISKTSTNKMHS